MEGTNTDLGYFRRLVLGHYASSRRALPWRHEPDPYRVLVSEIMLQQTQVERVLKKYPEFLRRFPDILALSASPLAEVLAYWQGLGYNRRAVFLWKCAQALQEEHRGRFPGTAEDLRRLPGIGHATAGAILAFAFNAPAAFIETNIRRAYINHFFHDRTDVRDREILPLVEATLDRDNPRDWYYALMDYGAMLKNQAPNPNRRSAHYARQAPFEGSDRQVRGRIIKTLVEQGAMTKKKLSARMGIDQKRLDRILSRLEQEGFLARSGARIGLS
ncbi:MAG TPA: MarR family transcriptional regulator [Deltaproteobacteria bacterium]|nr:MarR family transcriptional regulator [Deltaproteobacteria bacterium]HQI81915.1 MarR family transcriptional regulator [Deltaproteobacteria bacterium]